MFSELTLRAIPPLFRSMADYAVHKSLQRPKRSLPMVYTVIPGTIKPCQNSIVVRQAQTSRSPDMCATPSDAPVHAYLPSNIFLRCAVENDLGRSRGIWVSLAL